MDPGLVVLWADHSSGYPSFERKRRRRADLAKRKSAQVGGQR
jgi:hypothetical protein